MSGLRNILPITTAKVPIVKFEHRQSGLEADISLYNTLVSKRTGKVSHWLTGPFVTQAKLLLST